MLQSNKYRQHNASVANNVQTKRVASPFDGCVPS